MFDIHVVEYHEGLIHSKFSIFLGGGDWLTYLFTLKDFSIIIDSQKSDMILDRIL